MTGMKHGLVIGNNYQDSGNELKFAVADALKMKEILENKEVCNFDNVVLLINKTSREALKKIEKLFKSTHQNDLVFIYFSGHGVKDFANNLYLLFEDSNEEFLMSTSISFDLINKCRNYPQAQRVSVIIVLDCCYSSFAGMKYTDMSDTFANYCSADTVILTYTGSTGSPKSMEDEKLEHSVFSFYLIEGLEKGYADFRGDGYISIDDLYNYAHNMTTKRCTQSPKKEGSIEETVFIGKNPIRIREKEYESKKQQLLDEFGSHLPLDVLGECQTTLRKNYKNPTNMGNSDKIILGYIETLLKNDISSEKRENTIQNCIEAVQHLKGFKNNSWTQESHMKQEIEENSRHGEEERTEKKNEKVEKKTYFELGRKKLEETFNGAKKTPCNSSRPDTSPSFLRALGFIHNQGSQAIEHIRNHGSQAIEQIRIQGLKNTDCVNFTLTAPSLMTQGSVYEICVWAYLNKQEQKLLGYAREFHETDKLIIKSKKSVPVNTKTAVTVFLDIPGFDIKNPVDTIYWNREIANASFIVRVPYDSPSGKFQGKALLFVEGLMIAKLDFNLNVGLEEKNASSTYVNPLLINSAFASYASENRNEVLARIQGIQKVRPDIDIFMNIVSLRSGEKWYSKLKDEINKRDIFYLFWSEASSKSKSVNKEWKTALALKGIDFISPVTLVSPADVPPP